MTAPSVMTPFVLTVPGTDGTLASDEPGPGSNGVWDLIRSERREALDRFAKSYAAVRAAEDRTLTPDEVRALPSVRPDHPLAAMWAQRSRTVERFDRAIKGQPPGSVVDVGAGCGWFSAHMVRNGWSAAAVDVTVEGGDGLGEAVHHVEDLLLVRAEMAALPFASSSIDAAVFNAALHYAGSVKAALREAYRVVRPGGIVAVLDSPIYRDPTAGRAMVDEFAAHVQRTHGISAAEHEGPGFITDDDLSGFDMTRLEEINALQRVIRRARGARKAGRETASRPILIGVVGARS